MPFYFPMWKIRRTLLQNNVITVILHFDAHHRYAGQGSLILLFNLHNMKRRNFIAGVTGSIAYSMLAACYKEYPDVSQNALRGTLEDAANGTSTRYPLRIPGAASPYGLNLTAAPTTSDLGGGNMSNVWAYNGQFPGPTLRANSGDSPSIVFHNNLGKESIVHWHGMLVNHANDGQPDEVIQPGSNYAYNFTINQRAALNWYHPHPHMLTGEQVYYGLAGAFIVNDAEEAALNLPSGKY